MKISVCPGCLRRNHATFCPQCALTLFGGRKVDHILPFSRPEYNRIGLEQAARISISGVQAKHSLKLNGSRFELTDRGGRYILKPAVGVTFQYGEYMPANEHCTMQLARQVFGIEAAACALLFFNDEERPAYLTRRFDVLSNGTRLLMEDFTQIAQRSEKSHGKNYKYDASYEELAGLMKRYVSAYTIEVEKFFYLLLFNYLIHNGDAHLKNFSLCRDPLQNTYVLTPAYDLLNTRLHLPHEFIMAVQLFMNDYQTESFQRNGFYARDDFYEFGIRIGIMPKRVNRFLDTIVIRSNRIAGFVARSWLPEELQIRYNEMVADRVKALSYSYKTSQTL